MLYHCTVFCRIYSNKKKAKWERNIVRSKITVKTMLLIRFFYFYLEYMYTNSPFFNFSPGSIFLRCQLITWQKAYMSNLGILLVYLCRDPTENYQLIGKIVFFCTCPWSKLKICTDSRTSTTQDAFELPE